METGSEAVQSHLQIQMTENLFERNANLLSQTGPVTMHGKTCYTQILNSILSTRHYAIAAV